MITTADLLQDLVNQKQLLLQIIRQVGIEADDSETYNTLVPKVNDVYQRGKYDFIDQITNNGLDFSYFFYKNQNLITNPNIDLSKATNLSYMFSECSNLESVDNINLSNAIDISYMFNKCSRLFSANLDFSNVEKNFIFDSCHHHDVLLHRGFRLL